MNRHLSLAAYLNLFCLLVFGYTWQHSYPREKYSPVVEAVQDKAVMIEVPSTYVLMSFIMEKNKFRVEQSTVPATIIGSGVVVNKNGFVLSCAHLFESPITGPIVATLSDGTTQAMTLVYKSTSADLALLKISGNYAYAALSTRKLRLGQEVIAVGNPNGQQFSTSHGIVSYIGRDIGEQFLFTQIDALLIGGNSGGPLFNLQGELIGINARAWKGSDGLALAIAPSTIKEFLAYFNLI